MRKLGSALIVGSLAMMAAPAAAENPGHVVTITCNSAGKVELVTNSIGASSTPTPRVTNCAQAMKDLRAAGYKYVDNFQGVNKAGRPVGVLIFSQKPL